MKKIEPYEHKGKRLSELKIESSTDLENAIVLFREEKDKWLRKIIAKRIMDKIQKYDTSDYMAELEEALKCRIS